jgi:hypothetical protein
MVAPLVLVGALVLSGCAVNVDAPAGTDAAAASVAPTREATGPDMSGPPTCKSLIGKPASVALVDGQPYCFTGISVALDKTTYGTMQCSDVEMKGGTVTFWVSSDPNAADTNEYLLGPLGSVVVAHGGSALLNLPQGLIATQSGCTF